MLWPLFVLFVLASGTLVWSLCRAAAQLPPVRTAEDLERETVEWDAWEEEVGERRERRTS